MKRGIDKVHKKHRDQEIAVIIPCAGSGKRMKSYGPKSLINIGQKTIIENQIETIYRVFPKAKITVVCGFESIKLMSHIPDDIIKIENENYIENNVIRSIAMGMRANESASNVLIMYGDLLCNQKSLEMINTNKSCIVISDHMTANEVGCNIHPDNTQLEYMMYDLPNKWGQLLHLTSKELKMFKRKIFSRKYDKKFCFEMINQIIDENGKFLTIIDHEIMTFDIDTTKDLKIAKERYAHNF